MQILENTKKGIEAKAQTMSDFLKMEYLETCIKKFYEIEILRYCYQELAKLYEDKSMYSEALKYITKLKDLCILQREKIECLIKEIELFIKSGFYEKADLAIKESLKILSEKDRFEMKRKVIELYKQEANKFEKLNKHSWALKVYERLVNYIVDAEKTEIRKKMINSYKKLGRIKESLLLERELEKTNDEIELI